MATKKEPAAKPDRLESLRSEIIEILEEYLDALHAQAEALPGEQNVEPLRNAQTALNLFRPGTPNLYS
jgi:septum formation topological specificity factor MinE